MKIELWPLAKIKPYARNPRLNDSAVDAVAASIRQFGFRKPIVVDRKGVIVCGHTCLRAAEQLGLAKAPVHVARDLSAEAIKAYRITDNRSSELAEWDWEKLGLELADLAAAEYSVEDLGLGEDWLAKALAGDVAAGLTDPDDVPAPPAAATTRPGDLVFLGNHRLLCGDSAKREDVDRLVDGQPIHLVNMDPPYNVKVEPRSNNAIAAGLSSFGGPTHHQGLDVARDAGKAKPTAKQLRPKDRALLNDFVPDARFAELLHAWFENAARVLKAGHAFYIWGGYANVANYPPAIAAAKLYFSQCVIWHKQHPVLTRKDFMGDHEWCFYGWKAGAGHRWFGPSNVADVWSVKNVPHTKMVHLTEKPVELAVRAMQYSSKPGEHVLDLFGGSGSTLIAAEQTGRRAFLVELDPLYCDVIIARWEAFTGEKAQRPTRSTRCGQTKEARRAKANPTARRNRVAARPVRRAAQQGGAAEDRRG